ncbi:MAG: hypothetical protein OHK0022_43250 [Roseiflexaceae bacterium]
MLDEDAPNRKQRKVVIGVRYRCGPAQLTVRTSPARRATLDAFGLSRLERATLLDELPAALALLYQEV